MRNWIGWVIRWKKLVVVLTTLVTIGLVSQLRNLSVIIDPDETLPQTHPFIKVNNEIEKVFGNKFTIVLGVSAREGTIYQTPVLEVTRNLTQKILQAPGVVKGNVNGLAARKAKSIRGTTEGMEVRPLMESVPRTPEEMQKLKEAIQSNPVYSNLLISKDETTTQIVVEFKKIPGGFKAIENNLRKIIQEEARPEVKITLGGLPIFLSLLEKFSERMAFLFPLAVLIIGLIHYEAFRTLQALFLPLVTALFAVVWAVGVLALTGQPMDVFNASTPILILAIAAGHAVQILKRYYEEFALLQHEKPTLSRRELSELAVLQSLTKVGPVMVVACAVAALGFFSLMIFEIKSIRTFGIFTGSGVLAALILELTFIPALRSLLPPPGLREIEREKHRSFWDSLVETFYWLVTQKRKQIYLASGLIILALSLGGYWLRIENSQKSYFYGSIPERLDDEDLNEKMAGTNSLYVLVDGNKEDAIKRPDVLSAIDQTQRFLESQPNIGKSISILDFIKRMNQAMNEDQKTFYSVPSSADLVAQYLLLYSNSGEPGDFDSYVDYSYQKAAIQAFIKTDSSAYVKDLANKVKAFTQKTFPSDVRVEVGGGSTGAVALNEVMIKEKLLNILQIMSAVFLVSSLVFRSLTGGLFILVPLLAAVLVNFGVMGLLGIPLQIATALVSAMAVGIGADYGIYMSYRLREELRSGLPEDEAVAKAFRSAGKAAIFVSSAVAGGFGVLMLSWGFMIHIWMGFLIAMAMLVSSFAALTVFPSLILTFRPRFIFKEKKEALSMKALTASLLAVLLMPLASSFSLLILSPKAEASDPASLSKDILSAEEIAKRNFLTSKVTDSTSETTFRLINANGQERVRETKGSTKLVKGTTDNQRIVEFLSPSDVKGTKTLLIEKTGKDDDIWIYLPALKKVRRLVASNKKDSFVGTDFSYGDVIGHKVEDWNHKLRGDSTVDGRSCYLIESTPKSDAVSENSGYSKRVTCVDKESFIALSGEIFDRDGKLLKKIESKKIEKVDEKNNRWQPMFLSSENVQTGHKTILEFKDFKANVGVKDDLFTSRYLERK